MDRPPAIDAKLAYNKKLSHGIGLLQRQSLRPMSIATHAFEHRHDRHCRPFADDDADPAAGGLSMVSRPPLSWIQAIALMVAGSHIICKSFMVRRPPLGRPA